MQEENRGIELSIQNVVSWHVARNLIHGSSDKDQVLKLIQELGELSDSICKGQTLLLFLCITACLLLPLLGHLACITTT